MKEARGCPFYCSRVSRRICCIDCIKLDMPVVNVIRKCGYCLSVLSNDKIAKHSYCTVSDNEIRLLHICVKLEGA